MDRKLLSEEIAVAGQVEAQCLLILMRFGSVFSWYDKLICTIWFRKDLTLTSQLISSAYQWYDYLSNLCLEAGTKRGNCLRHSILACSQQQTCTPSRRSIEFISRERPAQWARGGAAFNVDKKRGSMVILLVHRSTWTFIWSDSASLSLRESPLLSLLFQTRENRVPRRGIRRDIL